jgi:hypothetical protein
MIATKVSASASRPPLCCTCTTRGTVIPGCSRPWARAHGKALRFCLSDLVRMKSVPARPSAAPNHRRVRGHAAAPATALSPCGRPGCRQNDHGRPADEGADSARRPPSCLVVCPGSLAEQWQDELYRRFHLPFEILTNDKPEAARTGNWFLETNLVIARLDKLSRNEDVQEKLKAPDGRWDLIVCDEAHKMSARAFGGEITYTKRYNLGQLLSTLTRHFLLMTATPHNGKEEDFRAKEPAI